MATAAATPTRLEIQRIFAAPRAKVFEAWTQPERVARWLLRRSDEAVTRVLELDARPGGTYRIEGQEPGQPLYRLVGVYAEVTPPRKLVFTWRWETHPENGESIVTVEFFERGAEFTEVKITHEAFPGADIAARHQQGWTLCLDQLERIVTAKEQL